MEAAALAAWGWSSPAILTAKLPRDNRCLACQCPLRTLGLVRAINESAPPSCVTGAIAPLENAGLIPPAEMYKAAAVQARKPDMTTTCGGPSKEKGLRYLNGILTKCLAGGQIGGAHETC